MTTFENKVKILSDYYMLYGDKEEYKVYNFWNHKAIVLAYCFDLDLCTLTKEGIETIQEGWHIFISALEIEDKGFEDLFEMFELTEK